MNTKLSFLRSGWLLASLALVAGLEPAAPRAQGHPRGVPETITIAVARDGQTGDPDIVQQVAAELAGLLPRTSVTFKESPTFDAGWEPAGALDALRRYS